MSFLMQKWEEIQDKGVGRQALIDDTKRAVVVDTYACELEKRLILNLGRFDTYPKVKTAIRDYVEQMRRTSELGEIAPLAGDDGEGWEEVHAIGRAKGKGNATGKVKLQAPAQGQDNRGAARGRRARLGDKTIPMTLRTTAAIAEKKATWRCMCGKPKGKGKDRGRPMLWMMMPRRPSLKTSVCAVAAVVEIGVGQPSARIHELPAGRIDPESFHRLRLYLNPKSGRDPWQGQVKKEARTKYHRDPPPPPWRTLGAYVMSIGAHGRVA